MCKMWGCAVWGGEMCWGVVWSGVVWGVYGVGWGGEVRCVCLRKRSVLRCAGVGVQCEGV